jgi:hypothetical protein
MGSFLFSTLLFTFCKKNNSIESAKQCSISPRLESWKHIITRNELKESRSRSSFCVFLNQTEEKRGTQLALKKPHTKQTKDFKQKIKRKQTRRGSKKEQIAVDQIPRMISRETAANRNKIRDFRAAHRNKALKTPRCPKVPTKHARHHQPTD